MFSEGWGLIWPPAETYLATSGDLFGHNRGLFRGHGHWEKGDFTRIAASMRESGEALVKQLGVTHGLEVLDLGCGDGTTALPAATLGANVLGVDIAANLVEAGNERVRQLGLTNCSFQEGDASDLHDIEDERFDLVVSIFGAMFAPKPFDVAKEMFRVTRPGGRIVMGNWIPGDPTLVAQILKISSAYSPPPPDGFVSPMTWGVKENVIERFAAAGACRGTDLLRLCDLQVQLSRHAFRPTGPVPDLLRAHNERLRVCGRHWEGSRTVRRAGGALQRAK